MRKFKNTSFHIISILTLHMICIVGSIPAFAAFSQCDTSGGGQITEENFSEHCDFRLLGTCEGLCYIDTYLYEWGHCRFSLNPCGGCANYTVNVPITRQAAFCSAPDLDEIPDGPIKRVCSCGDYADAIYVGDDHEANACISWDAC